MSTNRELICDGFPAGVLKTPSSRIGASRIDLVRSAITLSRSYQTRIGLGPFWSMIRSLSGVYSLLDGRLRPTSIFKQEPASYRGSDSFWLAEALTHWFAQTHLEIDVLLPVEKFSGAVATAASSPVFPKTSVPGFRRPRGPGLKSVPDFIGLAGPERHVLESKGRARFAAGGVLPPAKVAARNKALFQVCRVATVDGVAPRTRTACVFSFEDGATSGWMTDPGPIDQLDLALDLPGLIADYYGLFLDRLFVEAARPTTPGYVGVEFAPRWVLSIDKSVLEAVQSLRNRSDADRLLARLHGQEHRGAKSELDVASLDDMEVSSGPDGIRLEGPAGFELNGHLRSD